MGLADMGFSNPTPIQEQAIPKILEGKDILASAQTGTGKTAAFAIPLIEKLSANPKKGIRVLILAPTRELAVQIDEQFWSIGYHSGVSSACVYGGTDWGAQEKAIREGVNVLVATPGRLLDHIKVSKVDFSNLEFLVLDEADRMLDMGFIPDVRSIIHRLPKKRQTLLFSATLSDRIESLSRELTQDPIRINVSSFKPAEGVTQIAYRVQEEGKVELVLNLFDDSTEKSAIVFTSTKRGADSLGRALHKKGVKVSSMHGDRDQKEREATLADFKAGRINVIVATDVMARGIDVTGVSHVINYNVPHDLDDYIHRIGRTARAKEKGTAITLVSPADERYFKSITVEMKDRLKVIALPDGLTNHDSRNEEVDSRDNRRESSRNSNPRRNSSNSRQSDKPRPSRAPGEKSEQGDKPKSNTQTASRPKPQTERSESKDNRRAPAPRKAPAKPTTVEAKRQQRIDNVKRPFPGINGSNGKQATEKVEKNGIWSKITSIFSK
jgi:ATP-dependent RNA helicase RhlE